MEEDEVFYAELTRQMLLLTDEDEESHTRSKYLKGGGFQQRTIVGGSAGSLMPGNYFYWSETGYGTVPSWIESLWAKNGAGTGVFIPRVGAGNKSRRRHNKQRRKTEKSHSAAVYKIHV